MSYHERKIDAIFDYSAQEWCNSNGVRLIEEAEWEFPCPRCQGPASICDVTDYCEVYRCLNCNKVFEVA